MALCWRLAALAAMAIIAAIDWRRNSVRATKWREYGFLLTAGVLGGLLGIGIDQITATISSDYFVLGKGIAAGAGFRFRVAGLGLQAGLAMGGRGRHLPIANNPAPESADVVRAQLLRFAWPPIVAAIVLIPFTTWAVLHWDPLNLAAGLSDLLTPLRIERFITVWGIHLGIYTGGILGTI